MAPEQMQGKPQRASDQYALGIIIYEWLTGDVPFQGSFLALGMQHAMTPPPSLCQRLPTLSPAIEQVVMTALSKNPQQRFSSVRDFATAFEQACRARTLFPQATPQSAFSSSYSPISPPLSQPGFQPRADFNQVAPNRYGRVVAGPSASHPTAQSHTLSFPQPGIPTEDCSPLARRRDTGPSAPKNPSRIPPLRRNRRNIIITGVSATIAAFLILGIFVATFFNNVNKGNPQVQRPTPSSTLTSIATAPSALAPTATPAPTPATSVELRMQRQGDHFTAEWRVPGQNWQLEGEADEHLTTLQVGLDALATFNAPLTTAMFGYFSVSCS